jgi:glycosyltransferase involved in cell wall biosynthesis
VKTRYGWPERAQLDYPEWDLNAQRAVVETRVALFTRFAHFIIAGDSIFKQFLARWDVAFHTVPVDTERLQPPNPSVRAGSPLIIHAPNHRHVKGTEALLAACDELRAKGFVFDLRLVESVPRHEALDLYRDAAIIADQFTMGGFGIFALEGMALGKPVLTYLDEEHHTNPVFSHPIVNTTSENIRDVLAALLEIPELRRRIGDAARASVVRYQSFAVMGEVWTRIYRHMWWGEPLDLVSTRHFHPERGTRPLTEDPSQAEFWPVPVDDLIAHIATAIERAT